MAWRLRLAPEKTNFDFFKHQWITFGGSLFLSALAGFDRVDRRSVDLMRSFGAGPSGP